MSQLRKSVSRLVIFASLLLGLQHVASAQTNKIEGVWLNEEKDAKIQIYRGNDNKFYGKIIWLKDGLKDGKPKTDDKNPKANKRANTILGLIILKGFNEGKNTYEDGTVYDPNNGKTYDCTITYKGKTLSLRGYVGISLFGRTTTWERIQ
jgi:uncharacterized protein (DUF2147 family)